MSIIISNRYAKALFKVADKSVEKSKQYLLILDAIKELLDDAKIRRVMLSPVMPLDLKSAILRYILTKSDGDKKLTSFLEYLLQQGRVEILISLADAFRRIIYDVERVVEATVVTAIPIAASDLGEILKSLEKITQKKVILRQKTDKSILGGFVVRIGNKAIDLSLKAKLETVTQDSIR